MRQGKTKGLSKAIRNVIDKRTTKGTNRTYLISWLKHLKCIHRYDERIIDSYILELCY